MSHPRTSAEIRSAFLGFFSERGHVVVPSSGLIPTDPTMLLTTAGMVQFKPYMLGDEAAPYPRAASVQKCFRTTDIDAIGSTTRHLTFFEMLGNFSLGDYFKPGAIEFAWELVTEILGLDPTRLWVTVFESDDEAEGIWKDEIGLSANRIQRLGAADNFWAMGPVGPCGPCSEIYYDRGPEFGADGGPASGGPERFVEIWNLVFMGNNRLPDGSLIDLPRRNIDTGAGLERIAAILGEFPSVFETDLLAPMVRTAGSVTGRSYGVDNMVDISLRILADHARAMTFLIADGVVPSNEGRGYVLRRIIRRSVRHGYLLGVEGALSERLVPEVVATMGSTYPALVAQLGVITEITRREEAGFRTTLRRGLDLLDDVLARGDVTGQDAFFLHDTLGFPIDLTREIASERGRGVDLGQFDDRMKSQRTRAKSAHQAQGAASATQARADAYRAVLDAGGSSKFVGYEAKEFQDAQVIAILVNNERVSSAGPTSGATSGEVHVVLDVTPFFAESGGQVGDSGELFGPSGSIAQVDDTTYGLAGSLIVHRCTLRAQIAQGDNLTARVDRMRRSAIARNHTATHLLHAALREVLGTGVKQAGSMVNEHRLRFDFSHHTGLTQDEQRRVEALANQWIHGDDDVVTTIATRDEAEAMGAIAFFGDKYGESVRVLQAGPHSLELCGGTHVHNVGEIGMVHIVSEGSIGSNVRRIEAITWKGAWERLVELEDRAGDVATILRVDPDKVTEATLRLVAELKTMRESSRAAQAREFLEEGRVLAAACSGGLVLARRDGLGPDELRQLAIATRDVLGTGGVVILAGADNAGRKAAIAVAVTSDHVANGVSAAVIAGPAAKALGGGTARNPDVVAGGGPNAGAVAQALQLADDAARLALS